MMDIVLFKRKNGSYISFKTIYTDLLIYFFFLFLLAGNFFRLFFFGNYGRSLSLLEIIFYFSAVPWYFSCFRKSMGLLFFLCISLFYGILQSGWDTLSILYSGKFLAMIISGIAVGEALFTKYRDDPKRALAYVSHIFFGVAIIGWALLVLLPNANVFFNLLKEHQIFYQGDPHQKRFLSSFFDPNYYAAIACIPFILSLLLKKYFYNFHFSLSIFFTWSRSGIATFFLLIGTLFFLNRMVTEVKKIDLKKWKIWGCCGIIVLVALPYFYEEIYSFCNRLLSIAEDNSALTRWETCKMGWQYFLHHPFFGYGFNYFVMALWEDMKITAIDSSLLFTIVNFGLIPTLCLGFVTLQTVVNHFSQILFLKDKNLLLLKAFLWFYAYVFITIFFTCQFNHILYYQFWLIPIVAIFTFLEQWRKMYENSTGP